MIWYLPIPKYQYQHMYNYNIRPKCIPTEIKISIPLTSILSHIIRGVPVVVLTLGINNNNNWRLSIFLELEYGLFKIRQDFCFY